MTFDYAFKLAVGKIAGMNLKDPPALKTGTIPCNAECPTCRPRHSQIWLLLAAEAVRSSGPKATASIVVILKPAPTIAFLDSNVLPASVQKRKCFTPAVTN